MAEQETTIDKIQVKLEELEVNDNTRSRQVEKLADQKDKFDDMNNDLGDELGKRLATMEAPANFVLGRVKSITSGGKINTD